MANPRMLLAILMAAVLMLEGCSSVSKDHREVRAADWQKTELYFGLGHTTGKSWERFVQEIILTRFPQGFTVMEGEGYWRPRESSTTGRESSKVLVILHEPGRESDVKLDEIRQAYKNRFHQESVLRVDYPSRVSF